MAYHGIKKIFKAALINIEEDEIIEDVEILDENFSKYWWHEFLELEEKYTSAHNTERSMDKIDTRILSSYKKPYPSDYYILRNSFVGYFRTKSNFEIEEFISSIFENYLPVDENLPIDRIVERIRKLPEDCGFDPAFTISKADIKKRKDRKNYQIN